MFLVGGSLWRKRIFVLCQLKQGRHCAPHSRLSLFIVGVGAAKPACRTDRQSHSIREIVRCYLRLLHRIKRRLIRGNIKTAVRNDSDRMSHQRHRLPSTHITKIARDKSEIFLRYFATQTIDNQQIAKFSFFLRKCDISSPAEASA
jgi:hypothetical protein